MRNTLLSILAFAATLAAAHAQDAASIQVLHHFAGDYAESPLVEGSDGSFYGTTRLGNQYGTVFKVTPAGVVTVLHSFSATDRYNHNADGFRPSQGLIQASDGNFYGMTAFGGPNGDGIIYQLTPDGVYTKMHAFDPIPNRPEAANFDGAGPNGTLVQASDGNFYGTTQGGGAHGLGTVFRLTPGRMFTTLYDFAGVDQGNRNADGAEANSSLVIGQDGNFYGTTQFGGVNGTGTFFKITPAGVLTTLHSFAARRGTYPQCQPVQGRDGNFYGALNESGDVFRITPSGGYTVLCNLGNGSTPMGNIVQGSDGNFYGTAPGVGMFYRFTPTGVLTTLYRFRTIDGYSPLGGVVQGRDGRFYGTASRGGDNDNDGTFFAFDLSPVVASAATATAEVGRAFSYQIVATNSPTSYRAPGLPPGLTFNTKTGLIKGTPTQAGTSNATLQATNAFGTSTAPLVVTVQAQGSPFITSAPTASGTKGQPFSYQITADYDPTRFAVVGLPGGLHVDAATGLISGTPTGFATYHLTLKAINAKGTGTATLTLTIARS